MIGHTLYFTFIKSIWLFFYVDVIIDGPDDVIYFPGQGSIELTCTVSSGVHVPIWIINGLFVTLHQLEDGQIPFHNRNGTNIIIEVPVNGTEYACALVIDGGEIIRSEPAFIYIAGECIP